MAGSVKVVIKSVFDDKELKRASSDFANATKGIKTLGLVAGAALVGLGAVTVKFGTQAVSAASTLEESLNAVKVSYGDATDSIIKLGETAATRLGVSQADFNASAVRFSAFADSIVGSGGDVTGFLEEITTRASDFASVFNIEVSEALQVFQSGLSGEAEPLKRFGINLLESEVKAYALRSGLISVGDVMTEQQKVQARYGLIMESTAKTAGDFANTSDGLANSQRILSASFEDVQASIGSALLPTLSGLTQEFVKLLPTLEAGLVPVAEYFAVVFKDQVVPAVKDFAEFLASPEGTQAIKDLATAVIDAATAFVNFGTFITSNLETIKQVGTVVLIAVGTYKTLTTAIAVATTAQVLFNAVMNANPVVKLISAIALASAGIAGFILAIRQMTGAQEEAAGATGLTIDQMKTLDQQRLSSVTGEINNVRDAAINASNALVLVNGLIPASPTNDAAKPLNPKPGEVFTWFNFSGPNGQAVWYQQTWNGSSWSKPKKMTYTPPGGTTAPSTKVKKETTAERFAAVQKVIQDAQKKILAAEATYAGARFTIQKDYESSVTQLRKDAAASQLAIVQSSIDRLTSAFRSATQVSLGDLFNTQQVSQIETTVRQLTSSLTLSITRETNKTVTSSVGDLIASLTDKLASSRQLLKNSSLLASAGFSQTFIEQVIQTGAETGNALASAILDAGPDTQKSIRDLFGDLESVSQSGMDGLAREIYNSMGLATAELKSLYTQVSTDLNVALAEEQKNLITKLAEAASAFAASVADIKAGFLSDLAEFDGAFAGLGKTIQQLLDKIAMLGGLALTDTQRALTDSASGSVLSGATVQNNVALANLGNAQGIVVDSAADVAGTAAYLEARIKAAQTFIKSSSSNAVQQASALNTLTGFTNQLASLRGSAATGSAVGTVININVKTDSTQSAAMVGKTIGNVVSKYTTTGGQVLVSGKN